MKKYKYLQGFLFLIFLVFVVWVICFKLNFDLEIIRRPRFVNIIPFAASGSLGSSITFNEVVNNAIIFIPFGIYLQLLMPTGHWILKIFGGFVVSLILEITQFILSIGITDITDVIMNGGGALVGLILATIITKAGGQKGEKVLTIIMLCGTVAILILSYIISQNITIK